MFLLLIKIAFDYLLLLFLIQTVSALWIQFSLSHPYKSVWLICVNVGRLECHANQTYYTSKKILLNHLIKGSIFRNVGVLELYHFRYYCFCGLVIQIEYFILVVLFHFRKVITIWGTAGSQVENRIEDGCIMVQHYNKFV